MERGLVIYVIKEVSRPDSHMVCIPKMNVKSINPEIYNIHVIHILHSMDLFYLC